MLIDFTSNYLQGFMKSILLEHWFNVTLGDQTGRFKDHQINVCYPV